MATEVLSLKDKTLEANVSTNPKHYLDAETDLMLRAYIVGLADECIAANDYVGTKARLASFLAHHIYSAYPVELRQTEGQPPYFCSCSGALSAEELQAHIAMGHN